MSAKGQAPLTCQTPQRPQQLLVTLQAVGKAVTPCTAAALPMPTALAFQTWPPPAGHLSMMLLASLKVHLMDRARLQMHGGTLPFQMMCLAAVAPAVKMTMTCWAPRMLWRGAARMGKAWLHSAQPYLAAHYHSAECAAFRPAGQRQQQWDWIQTLHSPAARHHMPLLPHRTQGAADI